MSDNSRAREPKACRPCAYAKVRCEPQSVDGCKRCLRLKRECIMQAPGAHKRKAPKLSDVARLEQKFDSMVTVFAASSHKLLETNSGGGNGHQSQGGSPQPAMSPFDELIMPSDGELMMMLTTFRTEMAPYFPFVVVPVTMTVSELRQKKPFLFSTIVMVTCLEDATRQLGMASKIREHISTSIVIKGDQNIDLLQGLLVYLSWYHFQLQLGCQICSVVHLALAMLIDLGLHRKLGPRGKWVPTINHSKDPEKQNTHRTLEERRVYLGCFYINTIVAMCRRDMDPMRYTDYTEECCRVIEDAGEYPTDLYLVRLVRLHRMADRIRRILSVDECDPPGVILSAPIGMCIKSLEAELQQIKLSLDLNSPHNSIFLIHYYGLELFLYQIALEDDFPIERYGNYPLARLHILYSCLTSTKAFFDMFSSIPLRHYFNLPYPVWITYAHAAGLLSELLLFTGENWDQEYVRSMIDFPLVIDMLIGKIEEAVEVSHLGQPPYRVPEMFVRIIPRLRMLKELHEVRRTALIYKSVGVASDDITMSAVGDFTPDMMFQLPDDLSWQNFLFG